MTRVGFSTTKNVTSRIIRWFTKSRASHAWLLYHDWDWEMDLVMEATEGGFKLTSFERFKGENEIVRIFEPKYPVDPGVKKLAAKLGEGYDYLGLFGMVINVVGRWLKRKWKNPWASADKVFCSEAVAEALKLAEYPGFNLDPTVTEPEDLLEFFEQESP